MLKRFLYQMGTEKLRRIFWSFALLAVFINLCDDISIWLRSRDNKANAAWVDQSFRERRQFERLVSLFFSEHWESDESQAEAKTLIADLKKNSASNPEATAAVNSLVHVIATPPPREIKERMRDYRLAFQNVRHDFDKSMQKHIDTDMHGGTKIESTILGANLVDLILIFILLVVYFLERKMKDNIEDALNRAMDDLRSSNDRLRALTTARARKMRIAAHDIKSPLAALKGYSEIAREATSKDHPISNLLQRMDALTNSTLEMVNTLFSEEGFEPPQSAINLDNVLSEVCTASSALAKRKRQQIEFMGDGKTSLVQGNRTELMTCFYNLITNAIKYSPIGARIRVRWQADHAQIKVSIADQGPGFKPQDFAHMFEEGSTLSAKPTAGESASGYGLYSSKKIIQDHNGSIYVSNAKGSGAVVDVELPRVIRA